VQHIPRFRALGEEDSLCAAPAVYSSIEADELADLSDDEEELEEDDEDAEDGLDEMDSAGVNLRDLHLRSRFSKWLSQLPPGQAGRKELLLELFGLLEVSGHELEVLSSERRFCLTFCIASMSGCYEQCSQADIHSSVWDTSEGKFVLRPNVEAKFVLDDEVLASCRHFAATLPDATDSAAGSDSKKRSPWVDKARLSDRFGSDTLEKLGGLGVLLEFLGVVCADAGTRCYAGVLPFGLSADLFDVLASDVPASVEDIPRSPAGRRTGKSSSGSGQKNRTGSSKPVAPTPKAAAPIEPVSKVAQLAPSSRAAAPAAPKAAAQQRPPVAPAAKASGMPAATGPAVVTLGLGGNASNVTASSSAASPGSAADLGGASLAYPASNATTPAAPPVAPAASATPAPAKTPEAPHPSPPGRPNSRSRPRLSGGGASAKSGSASDARPASPKAAPASPKARPASPKAGAASPKAAAASSKAGGASPKNQKRQSSRGNRNASSGRRSAGGSG